MRIGVDEFDEKLRHLWRPMDDAAKNGSHYLIGWMDLPGQHHMTVAFWHSTKMLWVGSIAYSKEPSMQPTHYMVLPAPPWSATGER